MISQVHPETRLRMLSKSGFLFIDISYLTIGFFIVANSRPYHE